MAKATHSAARPRSRGGTGPPDLRDWQRRNPVTLARMAAGLTQRALAVYVGTSDVTIRALEQGARQSSDVLGRVDEALGLGGELAGNYARWMKRRPTVLPRSATREGTA